MFDKRKKILVTGVSGGIGHILANELVKDYEIIGVSRRFNENIDRDVDFMLCDLTRDDIHIEPDIVVHLAALTDPIKCQNDPELAYRINVAATDNLLKQLKGKGTEKFIYISTGSIYASKDEPHRENDKINCFNTYAETKYEGEVAALRYSRYFDIIILRPFFPYGSSSNEDRFVYRIFNDIKNDRSVILNKDDKPTVNPIHVADFIEAVRLVIANKVEGAFNVAGEERRNIREIAEILGRVLNKSVKFKYVENRTTNCLGDITKIKAIGFKPKIGLRQGLFGLK